MAKAGFHELVHHKMNPGRFVCRGCDRWVCGETHLTLGPQGQVVCLKCLGGIAEESASPSGSSEARNSRKLGIGSPKRDMTPRNFAQRPPWLQEGTPKTDIEQTNSTTGASSSADGALPLDEEAEIMAISRKAYAQAHVVAMFFAVSFTLFWCVLLAIVNILWCPLRQCRCRCCVFVDDNGKQCENQCGRPHGHRPGLNHC